MSEKISPRKTPCASCPYRLNAPSGVWHAEEYLKLPAYDEETFDQPVSLFMCHQGDDELCAGWIGCHGPDDMLALRLHAPQVDMDAVYALEVTTPLHPSGKAAADHGLRDMYDPSIDAQETMDKIVRARKARMSSTSEHDSTGC